MKNVRNTLQQQIERCTIALVFILLFPLIASGQQSLFHHITDRQGLSQSTVLSIYQDEFEQMWIATRDGLNKYNGETMKAIHHEINDEHSVSDNYFSHVTGDGNGNVYFSSRAALYRYNLSDQNTSMIIEGGVRAITYGPSGLLIARNGEVLQLDDKQNKAELLFNIDPSIDVFKILELSNGNICLGGRSGVYVADRSRRLIHLLEGSYISSLYEDRGQNLWVCTDNNGLFMISEGKIIRNYRHDNRRNSLLSNYVRAICEDDNGNYWIGTSRGVSQFNLTKGEFTHYTHAIDNPNSLSDRSVISLYKDKQGSIWIGTYFGGINFRNNQYANNTMYRRISSPNSLSGEVVSKVIQQDERFVWVATEDGGLNRLDLTTGDFTSYMDNPLMPVDIKSAHFDTARNTIFLGSHIDGFYSFSIPTSEVRRIKIGDTPSENNYVRAIAARGDNLYLGTHSSIISYNIESGEAKPLVPYDKCPELKNMQVWDVLLDRDDNLWFSSSSGIYRYNFDSGDLSIYKHDPQDPRSISSCYQNTFYQTQAGVIYIGSSGGGINIYSPQSDDFSHLNSHNSGLNDDYILAISQSSLGYILIATNKGLTRYNEDDGSFTHYPNRAFFHFSAINERGLNRGLKDQIFISSLNGLSIINDAKLNLPPASFQVNISNIYLNNQIVTPNDQTGVITESMLYRPKIRLKSRYSTLSVEYIVTNYLPSINPEIEYLLEGFDRSWNRSDREVITYTNLAPGDYKLRLRAIKDSSYVSPEEIVLEIKVLPPLYKSTVAYFIYLLILVAILLMIAFYYQSHLKLKSSLTIAKFEKEQTEELNQIKLRFFTNISHEFRLPLTLIKTQFEQLIESREVPHSIYLKMLSIMKSVDKMDCLFNELLDFRKQDQGFLKLNVKETNIVTLINEVCLTFTEYAESRKIALRFEHSVDTILIWADTMQLEKVFYNILSNAFKFSSPETTITIKISEADDTIFISTIDMGVGVHEEELTNIFERFYQCENNDLISNPGTGIGLALSKNIVEAHHGKIWAEQNSPQGTIINIEFSRQHNLDLEQTSPDKHVAISSVISDIDPLDVINSEKIALSSEELSKVDRTILIVEDNPDLLLALSSLFEPLYKVFTAADGEDGYNTANDTQPDIVLADVMMPKMSGTEMCRRLKSNLKTSHIPVVLLTARIAPEMTIEGFLNGADDYIAKPFNSKVLVARCNNIVNMRRTLQQKFANNKSTTDDMVATTPKDIEFLSRAVQLVEENISNEKLNVALFAKLMNLGRTNLFKKIKGITGQTPNDFIRTIRLKKAITLLENSDMGTAEISTMIGFNDPPYFIRNFKKMYGITPTQYRKMKQ